MTRQFEAASWPLDRAGEALAALARANRIPYREDERPHIPSKGEASQQQVEQWIQSAARWLEVELHSGSLGYRDLENTIRLTSPLLLRLPYMEGWRLMAFVHVRRENVTVVGADFRRHRLSLQALRAVLVKSLESAESAVVERLLEAADIPPRRRARARNILMRERLQDTAVAPYWSIRTSPGASFRTQLRRAGLTRRVWFLACAHTAQYLLWILSWWIVGRATLSGRLDVGWLTAWVLVLLTIVPFRVLTTWLQGLVAISAGGLIRARLLRGALRLEPEEVRTEGAGQFLGRVIESQNVESLALNGGFLALVAVIELMAAAVVLGLGAGGPLHAILLLAWFAGILGIGWRYWCRYGDWTDTRLALTHELTETMVGHRTRLAQEHPERWHEREDHGLASYFERSESMDRTAALLSAAAPRGWLLAGTAAIAPAFVSGARPALLAVSIGGILLTFQAFKRLVLGLSSLAGAAVSWQRVSELFRSGARVPAAGNPALALNMPAEVLVEARGLVFRYRSHGGPVLDGCDLTVRAGDRILLDGPSGGGKSSLASVLAGLRTPESGLLLVGGLDRQSLGEDGWRRRVAAAPQFHENHVLTGTFTFNLFMGCDRRIGPEDLADAESICRELGLGELVERMPGGLMQVVGDTGWQLSHGERSRVYIARALLQRSDLTILDESFAALDPENVLRAMECVWNRAKALLVIAHA